jgi:KDO2-lipid IV(A) lauroyltransferase
VRAVFTCGALNYWDTFALPYLSRGELLRLADVRGLEHVDAALARGNGAILVSGHLASVSLVGQLIPALGYRLTGLLEPIEPAELFEFFVAQRETFGAHLLAAGASPGVLRELLAALRRNEVLGLVTDRDITGTGPCIEFFGAPTTFPDGAAVLSLRTGAPILPAVARLRPDGTFEGIIEAPIDVPSTGDPRHDILALTQAVAGRLEYHIASHPDQWTVFQKRWPDAQSG